MTRTLNQVGYWSGLSACGATVAYVLVQILQVAGVLHAPLDAILIYATSLCIVVPFVLEMLALHYVTSGDKRFWTHAAVIFASIYAVFVTANYVIQLATVIPATLNHTAEPIRVLEQTPHSMYWDYDAIGYRLFLSAVFRGIALPWLPLGNHSAIVHADAGDFFAPKAVSVQPGTGVKPR